MSFTRVGLDVVSKSSGVGCQTIQVVARHFSVQNITYFRSVYSNESEERILRTLHLEINGICEIQTLCEHVGLTSDIARPQNIIPLQQCTQKRDYS